MARFYPLFSSSKGNAHFIGTEKAGILIDCGVSFKRLSSALETNRIPLTAVQAVFITHEHSDHVSGLKVLTQKTGIPVYSTKKTLRKLCDDGKISPKSPVIEMKKNIACADMEVSAFGISHDAVEPCGYKIHTYDDKYCAVCTDTGCITPETDEALKGCKMVLIESNYDEMMLRQGNYPLYLKKRILSETGHLSNDDCAVQVGKLIQNGTTHVVLGHISQENNKPSVAFGTARKFLDERYVFNKDYLMGVARVETNGGAVIF
ncbi:MAG: MBL fold metallo-hydrolase [Ruminococcus flavefaciens]|nr:MBL fold metallo-hydrolase [Ruminococcus flavefaciens]